MATTSDIYAHFIKSSDKSAAAVIDRVFNPETQQEPVSEVVKPADVGKDFPLKQANDTDVVADFKFIKAEMQRLGFDNIEEYEEYLEFVERKKHKRK